MAEGDLNNNLTFFSFFTIIITALSYSYFISSKLPKGVYKLISLLPIFYLFTVLPLFISSPFGTAVFAFFFTWLANFKLILFAFNRSPLHPPNSLIRFIYVASLPIKITLNYPAIKANKKSPLNVWTESLVFPILITIVYNHKQKLNLHVMLAIYCVLVFILVDLLVFISNVLVWTLFRIELDPPSNEPYLATSLQDFWGLRWNLMVTNILRHTIYKPLNYMLCSNKWGKHIAVIATFVVSGLMHELLFYYVTRVNPTWEMTSFFVLHGICVVVEVLGKKMLNGRLELPVVVARLFTVGFVVLTSFWLFFPPLITSGADVKVIEEFKMFGDCVKHLFIN